MTDTTPADPAGSVFATKLNELPGTIESCSETSVAPIQQGLDVGRTLRAVAVGSGGSLAAAHYFATCRRDLSVRPTSVKTPMEFVLSFDDLSDAQVWLFTGRGQNPDIAAALRAADSRGAADIRVVTANGATQLADYTAAYRQAHICVVPVADERDGFLSTHTLVAFVLHTLLATDALVDTPRRLAAGLPVKAIFADRFSRTRRVDALAMWQHLSQADTVLVLSDPTLMAAAVGLDTSLWETAIVAAQRTDLRNFAHGRHIWPARRAERTVFLVLTTQLSRVIWNEIAEKMPGSLRRHVFDYGSGGRLNSALAILDTLVTINAMGMAVSIDPGRPGKADYARPIYEGVALDELSRELSPPVRHKIAAAFRADGPEQNAAANYTSFLEHLSQQRFRGLVLDYDGTIVATDRRYEPPDVRIVEQLRRLLDQGLKLGIATGRGGSAGEALRDALGVEQQSSVIMGYYNGGYIRPLSDNIDLNPAPQHPSIAAIAPAVAEITSRFRLKPRSQGCQVSIDFDPGDVSELMEALLHLPGYEAGAIRYVRSQHSIDIVPVETNKLDVVRGLAQQFGLVDREIVCVGDSGHSIGNDHDLLGHPSGLSVDMVCARPDVCWAPFGTNLRGPEALIRILAALFTNNDDGFRIDVNAISASLAGTVQ